MRARIEAWRAPERALQPAIAHAKASAPFPHCRRDRSGKHQVFSCHVGVFFVIPRSPRVDAASCPRQFSRAKPKNIVAMAGTRSNGGAICGCAGAPSEGPLVSASAVPAGAVATMLAARQGGHCGFAAGAVRPGLPPAI